MKFAKNIVLGDYIRDLGTVISIQNFSTQVATAKSGSLPENAPYYQQVAEQLNCCYENVDCKVSVETQLANRCFYHDDLVDVVEIRTVMKEAA